jgi:RHS repeat-associated protein
VYDADGNLTRSIDPDGNITVYTYDADGRQVTEQVYQPDGVTLVSSQSSVYDPDGNLLQSIDGAGNVTQYTYDADGRKTFQTTGYGTPAASTTQYVYDADGNLLQVIDPDHNTTSFAYDTDGRKTSMTDPLGHISTWTYDADGNVISATDRDGRTITSQYDADGALVQQILYAADGSVLDTLAFTYDADGNLLTAANSQGTYSFSYDGYGRITSVQEPFGLLLSFTYDADGNRVQVADSLGGAVNSVYDAASQLVSRTVTDASGATGRIDLAYDQAGYLTRLSRFADLAGTQLVGATITGYDAAGRIGSIVHQNGSGATLDSFNYTFDVASQLTSETDARAVTNYSYDASSQLTGAGNTAYSYDANGNPTNAGDVVGAANQLLSDGTWNYTYDNEGNLVQKVRIATGEKWGYGYDDHNQLVSVVRTAGDGTLLMNAAYRYDVFGNRLEKDVWTAASGTVVSRFAYDGWKNGADALGRTDSTVGNENWDVWADLDATGSLTTRYLRGDVVDQVFAQVPAGGQIQWLLTDHLGSVRDLTNAAGVNLNHMDYDAFGNIVSQANGLFVSRYAYTGRETDPETGFEFERGRYYDPHTGRWSTEDPMGFDASDPNLYRYATNRPTEATDPSGLDSIVAGKDGWRWVKGQYKDGELLPSFKIADYNRNGRRSPYLRVGETSTNTQTLQWAATNFDQFIGKEAYTAFWNDLSTSHRQQIVQRYVQAAVRTDGRMAVDEHLWPLRDTTLSWAKREDNPVWIAFVDEKGASRRLNLRYITNSEMASLVAEGLAERPSRSLPAVNFDVRTITVDDKKIVFRPHRTTGTGSGFVDHYEAAGIFPATVGTDALAQDFDAQTQKYGALNAGMTFGIHLIPLGAAVDYAFQGNWWEAGASALGDAGAYFTFGATKARKIAGLVMTAGVIGYRTYTARHKFSKGDIAGGLGDVGEIVLRVVIGAKGIKQLRSIRALSKASAMARGGARLLSPDEERALLQSTAKDLASYLARTQSNAERGAVLTVLRDRVTGELFDAQNLSKIPDKLHPLLQSRLETYLRTSGHNLNPVWGVPGAHAEIGALNKALLRREALGLTVKSLDDFAIYNVSLWRNRLGTLVPRCGNCKFLTRGVRVLSGD